MNLKENGIDAGLFVAGLGGSLMMMSKTAGLNVGKSLLATVGGAASANYVTPLILHVAKLDNDPTYSFSIAYLLGFTGLRAIELITSKIFTDESVNHSKRRR